MPRLVNYADRFDAVREAVYVITLRDGPGAISLPAVAEESYMSARTLQRLVSAADHLPHLGLQWADRQWRRRCLVEHRVGSDRQGDDTWSRLVRELLDCLPGAPDEPDDRRAWWALVTAFEGGQEWALTARTARTHLVESLAAGVLAEAGTAEGDHAYEHERLCVLVDGLSQRILAGRVTHSDASSVVRRHLTDLRGPAAQEDGDAA
jgi:hypothetical protein